MSSKTFFHYIWHRFKTAPENASATKQRRRRLLDFQIKRTEKNADRRKAWGLKIKSPTTPNKKNQKNMFNLRNNEGTSSNFIQICSWNENLQQKRMECVHNVWMCVRDVFVGVGWGGASLLLYRRTQQLLSVVFSLFLWPMRENNTAMKRVEVTSSGDGRGKQTGSQHQCTLVWLNLQEME